MVEHNNKLKNISILVLSKILKFYSISDNLVLCYTSKKFISKLFFFAQLLKHAIF